MAPRKTQRAKKPDPKPPSPVDVVIEETVVRHGEEAKREVERDEKLRLAVRGRIGNTLFRLVKKELADKQTNGMSFPDDVLAKKCEELAKQIGREFHLEPQKKKRP